MAGAMRKMAVYLGLVEDEFETEAYEEERPSGRYSAPEPRVSAPVSEARTPRPAPEVVIPPRPAATLAVAERPAPVAPTPMPAPVAKPVPAASSSEFYRITTLHPGSYSDARRIGEEYREGVPVIVNLTGMEDADAKRIVDFAAGLIFGLRGTIERVTNKVFLLSPANVDVGAAARAQIAKDGFFNQS